MNHLIHCVDRQSQLVERRTEWIEFADRFTVAAPFCHPRVWLAWLEAFPRYEPSIFELREGGRLKAVLPFCRDGSTLRLSTGAHLDYQDIAAVSDAAAAALLRAAVEHAAKAGLSITFDKVAEHTRLRSAIDDPGLSEVAAIKRRFYSFCPSGSVQLAGPGGFLKSLSGTLRRDCKVATRRACEAYPDHVVEHRLGSEIKPSAIGEAARIHQESQHRKKGPSVFSDPGFPEFIERQAAADAPILLSMIRESPGGRPMAFNLGYFADDTYYYYIPAYDEFYLAVSPGRRLLAETLCHCAERVGKGQFRFDLLSGQERYKFRWATSYYEVERIQVIPKRFSNLPKVAAYSAVYGLKAWKNRLLKWKGNELIASLRHEAPSRPGSSNDSAGREPPMPEASKQ